MKLSKTTWNFSVTT
ncbi:unnamed protein product, partial [Allacma fusca]